MDQTGGPANVLSLRGFLNPSQPLKVPIGVHVKMHKSFQYCNHTREREETGHRGKKVIFWLFYPRQDLPSQERLQRNSNKASKSKNQPRPYQHPHPPQSQEHNPHPRHQKQSNHLYRSQEEAESQSGQWAPEGPQDQQ
jgi:hypothetical protein